MLDIFVRY